MINETKLLCGPNAQKPYTKQHLRRWVHMVEERDNSIGHGERVARHAVQVASFLDNVDPVTVEINALLHDVGKMVVPLRILRKPSSLTKREYQLVKYHSQMGAQIIANVPGFEWAAEGALFHHERYDGRGYPYGLSGTDIPLVARIITVVDSFDAMISTRPYGKVSSIDEAIQEIIRCRGSQFDPLVVDAMIHTIDRGLI